MNLADDMDYLVQSDYFNENRGKLYELEQGENPFANFGSRNNKNKLNIHGDDSRISLEEIVLDGAPESDSEELVQEEPLEIETEECVYEKESVASSEDSSNDSEVNYSSDDEASEGSEESEDEGSEEEESEGSEDEGSDEEGTDAEEDASDDDEEEDSEEEASEIPLNGYIYNFPVQMICLEKCQGTLDRLFLKRILNIETAASALFQVIMILMAYQKAFAFTHNDLHTNNIMHVETQQDFIYYKAADTIYKVPTHGRIFKLIDFGRAIYRFQGRVFCSDSFAPGGDASTQYNCEPFMTEKKPRLDPNMSFDLCRLGCSIYDFILEVEEEQDPNFEPDLLQQTIIDWVTDDNGKNILYMKNGDERYPNFKLYKMIARTVHKKTPGDQLKNPLFASFETVESPPEGALFIDIDAVPSYIL
jgi:hypothetical protein